MTPGLESCALKRLKANTISPSSAGCGFNLAARVLFLCWMDFLSSLQKHNWFLNSYSERSCSLLFSSTNSSLIREMQQEGFLSQCCQASMIHLDAGKIRFVSPVCILQPQMCIHTHTHIQISYLSFPVFWAWLPHQHTIAQRKEVPLSCMLWFVWWHPTTWKSKDPKQPPTVCFLSLTSCTIHWDYQQMLHSPPCNQPAPALGLSRPGCTYHSKLPLTIYCHA